MVKSRRMAVSPERPYGPETWPIQVTFKSGIAKTGISLSLLGILHRLVFPSPLDSLRGVFGVQKIIPPPEAAGIISYKLLVMEIMVVCASPEREEVMKTPWKLIATVRINGLEKPQDDPDVHRKNMQIAGYCTP